jgi:isopentenyldiphosphate isomerase
VIDPADTLVDIVDTDDHVIDVVPRREMRARNLRHRSVGIAVLESTGRVLIHRRADDKDVWPGRWDLAVGGVVESGETWDTAAVRELAE